MNIDLFLHFVRKSPHKASFKSFNETRSNIVIKFTEWFGEIALVRDELLTDYKLPHDWRWFTFGFWVVFRYEEDFLYARMALV